MSRVEETNRELQYLTQNPSIDRIICLVSIAKSVAIIADAMREESKLHFSEEIQHVGYDQAQLGYEK